MNKIKQIMLLALLGIAYSTSAQMVVSNPTQDFILIESKIETASNWLQQLKGLQETIEQARKQAAKLDSTKRAMEKAYNLQEEVRKDVVKSYNAVKKMNVDNLAHIAESYLGFSINPKDYLPDMPGLEGYSEFRSAVDYDPKRRIAAGTSGIDRFLSSMVLTDSTFSIDNPVDSYFRKLDQINNLAGAYGSFYLYRKKGAAEQRAYSLAQLAALKETLLRMLDSVNNPTDMILLRSEIARLDKQTAEEIEKANEEAQEMLDMGVRVIEIQEIAAEKQKDIIVLTAAITTHYNLNKGFSLRKLAKNSNNKAAYEKVRQQSRQDMEKISNREE